MNTCFVLCNVSNGQSGYVVSGFAGSNLSKYLARSLSSSYRVELVNVGAPSKRVCKKEISHYEENHYSIAEFPSGNVLMPIRFRSKIMIKNAVKYILRSFKKGDKIVVYHSLSFSDYYKKIVKQAGAENCAILVAEIYSDVGNIRYKREKEIAKASVFRKFVFMSGGIRKSFEHLRKKAFIYLYGAYNVRVILKRDVADSRLPIHLVYAGTPSLIKGGLMNAIKACESMDGKCVLHVYSSLTKELKTEISKYRYTRYEGYFEENDLFSEIQEFDIGLATQDPMAKFNSSSFPSKIVNYLACGLSVVSTKSESVIKSPFANVVRFYDVDNPSSFAEAVRFLITQRSKEENVKMISKMNDEFTKAIKGLLEE